MVLKWRTPAPGSARDPFLDAATGSRSAKADGGMFRAGKHYIDPGNSFPMPWVISPSPPCEYTESAGTNELSSGSEVDGVGRICCCNGAIADPLPVPSSPSGAAASAEPEDASAWTLAAFAAVVGETFALDRGGDAVPATLTEARSLGFNRPAARGGRESFALLFHVPPGTRVSQGIHGFAHPRFGRQEWFLVPIGPDARGLRLEVIFNFI